MAMIAPIAAVVFGLLSIFCFASSGVFGHTPSFASLTVVDDKLTGSPTVNCGRSGNSCSVFLPLVSGSAWITNVCYIWSCDHGRQLSLGGPRWPPEMSELKAGDSVRVWLSKRAVWQLAQGDDVVLSYARADEGNVEQNNSTRGFAIFAAVVAATASVIWFFQRRRDAREQKEPQSQAQAESPRTPVTKV